MDSQDQKFFKSIPWCHRLLQDPNLIIAPPYSRQPKPQNEDSLFASTLKSNTTIPACLTVFLRPLKNTTWINEVHTFMSLNVGMNGGPSLLHGGIAATLLDDQIGSLLTINQLLNQGESRIPIEARTVTAYLNVRYMKAIETPGVVVVVARCREVVGRKYFFDAWIEGEGGEAFVKADSLWVRLHEGRGKL